MSVGTQAFTAQPQAITAKFREDEDDVYYANIHFDKRVHRGSNYSRPEGGHQGQPGSFSTRAPRRRKKEPPIEPFAIDLPKPERLPVDLLRHLVEKPIKRQHNSESSQTDAFKPKPATPPFRPRKTGVDAATHIEEGELFNFNVEVAPLLDVLVTKTLEQATMEIEQDAEMAAMEAFKQGWLAQRITDRQIEEETVDAERRRYAATQKLKKATQDLKEDDVRKKIMCQHATRRFLKSLCQDAVDVLHEDYGLLIDKNKKDIENAFMPWILGKITDRVKIQRRNNSVGNALLKTLSTERFAIHTRTMSTLKQKQRDIDQAIKDEKQRRREEALKALEEPVVEESRDDGGEGAGEGGEGGEGEAVPPADE